MTKTLLILGSALMLIGCSSSANTATVDGIVGEIVKHAQAGDTGFFAKYLDSSYKGQEKKIVQQIKASGMADNYKTRLEDVSDTKARLNYHYLEKGCHFQIDLEKQNGYWTIKRIWFCR